MSDFCVCGHPKDDHVYGEGACRPGYRCAAKCQQYTPESSEVTENRAVSRGNGVDPALETMSQKRLIALYQAEQAKSRALEMYANRLERLLFEVDL